jgi:hypothetical protein
MGDSARPLSVNIEHDVLVKVQKLINAKLSYYVSLNELRRIIESRLRDPDDEITIEL